MAIPDELSERAATLLAAATPVVRALFVGTDPAHAVQMLEVVELLVRQGVLPAQASSDQCVRAIHARLMVTDPLAGVRFGLGHRVGERTS